MMSALERQMTDNPVKPEAGETASDETLLAAIALGDRLAFRVLMERHAPKLTAVAQRVMGSPHEADDVVQDAFIKVWTKNAHWRADGTARFSTWMYRIVLNQCIDRKRKRSFVNLDDAGDPAFEGPDGQASVEKAGMSKTLSALIDSLPDRQAQALRVYYFAELSGPEAAQVMDLTLSAFEALLFRARKALRTALDQAGVKTMGDILA
jgi:RNA polymerase sigma-70 factor (ECF subfamily)